MFISVVTMNSLVRSLELGEYEGRFVFNSVVTINSFLTFIGTWQVGRTTCVYFDLKK